MNTGQPIKLLIVSDNHIVRSGLRRILESRSRIVVIGDTSIREASMPGASLRNRPELVLVDLDANGADALALVSKLKKDFKNTVVLVMGDLGDERRTRKALELGAAGVVLKLQPPSVLIAAIESLFSPHPQQVELRKVEPHERGTSGIHGRGHAAPDAEKIANLTERERDIVALIMRGLKNKDIAEQLHISDITVRHHLTNIFGKLGVSNRQKLLLLAHQHGLAKLRSNPQVS